MRTISVATGKPFNRVSVFSTKTAENIHQTLNKIETTTGLKKDTFLSSHTVDAFGYHRRAMWMILANSSSESDSESAARSVSPSSLPSPAPATYLGSDCHISAGVSVFAAP